MCLTQYYVRRCSQELVSGSGVVQTLQQVMGGQLHVLVPPLRCPVAAGDQSHPVNPAEVTDDEGIPGLGVVGRSFRQTQMPGRVLLPVMTIQVRVLVVGGRLDITPLAVKHVLASIDQGLGLDHSSFVDGVGRHDDLGCHMFGGGLGIGSMAC